MQNQNNNNENNVYKINNYLISHACYHSNKTFDCYHVVYSLKDGKIQVMNVEILFELLRKENVKKEHLPSHFHNGWDWFKKPWYHRLTYYLSEVKTGIPLQKK
jgi:hypothetical protein